MKYFSSVQVNTYISLRLLHESSECRIELKVNIWSMQFQPVFIRNSYVVEADVVCGRFFPFEYQWSAKLF
jgi:hypothetical protein